jgi:hypothetical protein
MPDPIKVAEPPPASATPAAVPPVPGTPSAAVKPAVTPPPAAPQGGTTVPLPELMEERNKRQALEKTVQDLQTELGAMRKVAPSPAAPQQAVQHDDVRKQIDQLWETDPRRAVQAEIMTAMTWYDQVQASIDAQEHNLAQKHPDFNNVRTEVRSYVRALPIEQRMREGIVDLAYYAVKGQRFDTSMDDIRKQWEAEFLRKLNAGEITNVPSGAVSAPPPASGIQATEDERKVAEAMGMNVDDYLKHKRGGAR